MTQTHATGFPFPPSTPCRRTSARASARGAGEVGLRSQRVPHAGAPPDEFRAFFAYHDALMDKDGGLTKAEREMIVVATIAAPINANIA